MTNSPPAPPTEKRGAGGSTRVSEHAPVVVLLNSLLLTLVATLVVGFMGVTRDRERFERAQRVVEDRIESRLGTYTAMLYGVRAFLTASDTVSADAFRRYVAQLEIARRFPGAQGIGFSRRLSVDPSPGATPAETSGASTAPADGGERHAIVFLEPLDRRNRAAIGFDMFRDSVRRDAMTRARDSGASALSGRVELVQEIAGVKQPGFLLYVPIYAGGGVPATVEERRARLVGFAYSPFRAGDLFTAVFAGDTAQLDFHVFDGEAIQPAALLYDSSPEHDEALARGRYAATSSLAFGGHRWTLGFTKEPHGWVLLVLLPAVALGGIALSGLLYRVSRSETRARRAAERSEAVRARFYAAMSHELRTPINAIIGYNDLILDGIYGEINDRQRSGLARSQRAARHLTALVNDVLDMSKLEAGMEELELEDVAVVSLIDEVLYIVRPVLARYGTEVRVETACRHAVRTDPRRLRQILLNLLSNAAKFGDGKPVKLRCTDEADGSLRIEVEDQGLGIAEEDLDRVFEEFVQLRTGQRMEGTGLGLPISRRLAELLGGQLDVRSEPGRGSTFRLVLPRASA